MILKQLLYLTLDSVVARVHKVGEKFEVRFTNMLPESIAYCGLIVMGVRKGTIIMESQPVFKTEESAKEWAAAVLQYVRELGLTFEGISLSGERVRAIMPDFERELDRLHDKYVGEAND